MSDFLPDIFGRVVEKDGVEVVLPLSNADKYAREFKESDVKRGGDPEHPGRFSSKGGSGAATEEKAEESDDPAAIAAGQKQVGSPEQRREELLKANIGIPRHDMPQIIGGESTNEFVKSLAERGVEVSQVQIPVGQLKGTQSELNMKKVSGMVGAIESGAWNPSEGGEPVLASSDGYILDGHHRWAAQRIVDPHSSMTLLQANLPIRDLLDEAHSFDEVQYAGVQDKAPVEAPEIVPSKAQVTVETSGASDSMSTLTEDTLADEFSESTGIDPKTLSSLSGAPDDSKVSVRLLRDSNRWIADVSIKGEGYIAVRSFEFNRDGTSKCHNLTLTVKPHRRGQGLGTQMLSKQVHFCRQSGVETIQTEAAGNGRTRDRHNSLIGYDVWPKLGYNANLPVSMTPTNDWAYGRSIMTPPPEVLSKLGVDASNCEPNCLVQLQDILKHREGRDWWRENGEAVDVYFDTREDSRSSKILDRYMRRKRAAGKLPDKYQREDSDMEGQVENPDLSIEELKDLEAMWVEMEDDGYTTSESQDN